MRPSHVQILDMAVGSGSSLFWTVFLATGYPTKYKEVAKVMSRFYRWSKLYRCSEPGVPVQRTDFFAGSPLSRNLQIKTVRTNNSEE